MNRKWIQTACCLAAFLTGTQTIATPTCDETTRGAGCIALGGGGSGAFAFNAVFDIETGNSTGALRYVDSAGGFTVVSTQVLDYSVLGSNARGFIYAASGGWYNEARVYVWDYGTSGDFFEIQLQFNGTIVYQKNGFLTEQCGGGISIVSDCTGGPRPPTNPGTGTPGYWMNHPEAWPITAITIGGVTYTRAEAIAVIKHPTRGDVSYSMFQAFIAATLNVLIGNDGTCIEATLASAELWLQANPVGSGVTARSSAWQGGGETLKNTLDAYNNGLLCAPSRD